MSLVQRPAVMAGAGGLPAAFVHLGEAGGHQQKHRHPLKPAPASRIEGRHVVLPGQATVPACCSTCDEGSLTMAAMLDDVAILLVTHG